MFYFSQHWTTCPGVADWLHVIWYFFLHWTICPGVAEWLPVIWYFILHWNTCPGVADCLHVIWYFILHWTTCQWRSLIKYSMYFILLGLMPLQISNWIVRYFILHMVPNLGKVIGILLLFLPNLVVTAFG